MALPDKRISRTHLGVHRCDKARQKRDHGNIGTVAGHRTSENSRIGLLLGELGYHRLELKIYAFNERARAHAERAGYVREGVKRSACLKDGEWVSTVFEATNYFFSLGEHASVLELTYNHDERTYDVGTGYGHFAVGVDDIDATLAEQGIEPEREPYRVREGGSLLCFVRGYSYRSELIDQSGKLPAEPVAALLDIVRYPDGYRLEIIDRSGK